MTVKEHYDHNLGNIYSWFSSDFNRKKNDEWMEYYGI